jgi:outer membrane protein insertion porin family
VARIGVLPFRVFVPDAEKAAAWSPKILPAISQELAKDERVVLVPGEKMKEALAKAGETEIDEEGAREIGRAVEADFMILGSVTQINGAISVDARVVDVYQPGILASAFGQGGKPEDLPEVMARITREIRVKALKEEMITHIGVEGNRAIEESAVQAVIKMKPGDVLSPSSLRADVKSIYQLGYFQDVRAEKRDWGRGKAIFFILEEKPVIREIKFSGNKKVKSGDLLEVMDMKTKTILAPTAVKENENKILKKYREEAYYNATVETELTTPRKGDIVVHFKINEGEKVRIQKIAFSGNLNFPDSTLKGLLPETREANWLSWILKTGVYKEDVLERDTDAILAFYMQKGFMEVKIGKPEVIFEAKGITIRIPIEEGKQYKIGKVDIRGDLIAPKAELFPLLKVHVGEIMNRLAVRDSVIALTDLYADRGYAFVDVNPITQLQPEKSIADLTFDIRQGSKVYFERIQISGNVKTRDKVIRRELRILEGELYSLTGMKRSRDNLNALGYFKEANINTKKGSGDDKMVAEIQVEEAPTGAFSVGAGYSSIDKFVGIFSINQNNLFGRGQKLALSAQLGSISHYYNLMFTDPYLFDTPLSFTADLYNTQRDYTDYVVDRFGGGIRLGYPLFELVRAYGGYKYEKANITDILPNASQIIKDQEGISTTSMVSLALRRDTRNHYYDPTAGSDLGVLVDFAGGPLGGTNYFTRYGAEARYFLTPHPWVTFMTRARIGFIQGNDGREIPLQERYRLGGITTVRGFEAWSIGPKAENGEVIGGDKELLFNFEVIFPIAPEIKLKGVVFFDAGNAWDVGVPYRLDDLRTSVGFGLRWFSPVGPLRVEWGYNLRPLPGEKQSSWDFAVGTFF